MIPDNQLKAQFLMRDIEIKKERIARLYLKKNETIKMFEKKLVKLLKKKKELIKRLKEVEKDDE